MAILISNSFTSYEFTDKEALQGSIYTSLQLQVLQNQLSIIATEKLNLEFDTDKPQDFIQQEAYKKGQLDLVAHLIETSAISADELNNPTVQD